MKKMFQLVILGFVFCVNSFSQDVLITFDEYGKHISRTTPKNVMNLKNIEGSPYYKDEFQNGEIVVPSNRKYLGIPIRYNIYNDEFEYRNGKGDTCNIEKTAVQSVLLDGKEFVKYPYLIGNQAENYFFQVLIKGKITFLKRYHINYSNAESVKAFSSATPAKFDQVRPTYYALLSGLEVKPFDSLKSLLMLLPSYKEEVEQFVKAKKLKLNKEDDIMKVGEYYNSLVK